jgi:hypothetical protein
MRRQEVFIMVSIAMIKLDAGAWDEAEDLAQAAVDLMPQGQLMPSLNLAHVLLSQLAALRGDVAGARAHLALLAAMAASDDTQDRIHAGVAAAATASSAGDHDHALTLARASTFEAMHLMGPASDLFRVSWTYAIEAALAADNLDAADELLALVTDIPPGQLAPFLRAQLPRCRALVAARRDEDPTVVRTDLLASVDALAELGYSYWHARAQLDLAQEIDRADEDRHGISDSQDIRAQAEATLDRLGVPRTGRGSQTARLDLVTEAQTQST